MRRKLSISCISVVSLIVASACASDASSISKIPTPTDSSKIAVGKFSVIDVFGLPTKSRVEVCFKSPSLEEPKCSLIKVRENQGADDNYVFVDLPQGKASLYSISLSEGGMETGVKQYYFNDDGLSFTVSNDSDVTYFGHITAMLKDVNENLPDISFEINDNEQDALTQYEKKTALASVSHKKSLVVDNGKKYQKEIKGETPFQKIRTPVRSNYFGR